MIGALLQPRRPSITSLPSMSGRPEVEDHDVGRMARRRGEGRRAVAHGRDLVVARAQVDRERLADRALVVHHEHVGHRRERQPEAHGQAAAVGAVGDQHAVHRLGEPARDGEAEPRALLCAVARAREWLEQPLALRRRDARTVVHDLDVRVELARPRHHLDRAPPPWRIAFSSRFASTRSSSPGSALTSGRSSGTSTDTASRAPGTDSSAAPITSSSATGTGCTLSAPASSRLASSRFATIASSRSADSSIAASSSPRCSSDQLHVGLAQRADRRLDPGERRAEIVADGGEEGGPLAVGRGELARLARALRQPPALVGGLGRPRRTRAARAGPRRTAPGRGRSASARCRSARRSGAAPPRRAAPSRRSRPPPSRRTDAARALSATDSMPNVVRARSSTWRSVSCSSKSLRARSDSVSACRAARSAARARRAAASTAQLTTAATTRNTASASACSPCATWSVCSGFTKK